MEKFILYVGLNNKDTETQIIATDKTIAEPLYHVGTVLRMKYQQIPCTKEINEDFLLNTVLFNARTKEGRTVLKIEQASNGWVYTFGGDKKVLEKFLTI